MKSAISAFLWLGASILVSELLGYLLHRLLHSGKVKALSRGHMKHHLSLYGPLQSQRPSTGYQDATTGEIAIGNVGLEWLLPATAIIGMLVAVMTALKTTPFHQGIFVTGCLTWSFLMFSFLHDAMHIEGHWLTKNKCLKRWFLAARRLHDIHHRVLNDRGLMDRNFGIGFFAFDRLFGTLSLQQPPFNHRGYSAAKEKFHC